MIHALASPETNQIKNRMKKIIREKDVRDNVGFTFIAFVARFTRG